MTRVRVVASSPVVRAGLETMLSPALVLADEDADVVVVDVEEWDDDSISEWMAFGAPVVALLPDLSEAPVFLRSGVRAVLPRNAEGRELLAAVEAVAAGLVVASAAGIEQLLGPARPRAAAIALTPREVEVLRLLADGEGNKQIAWRLGITEHTVKFHVASILTKLNAGTRTEAVAIGIRQGIVML